jgi:hypothetical protein
VTTAIGKLQIDGREEPELTIQLLSEGGTACTVLVGLPVVLEAWPLTKTSDEGNEVVARVFVG